ncbi:MAG: extracellular solute-binding protein [Chloroflexi bacterium]|nr:extracellular solute-binding protein [Chloroflexota bacterium]
MTRSWWVLVGALALGVLVLAGCGGETSASPTPAAAEAGVEPGPLVLYSYEETVTDEFLQPFREKYPQVELKTAVFGELDEALAKLRGGFKADVINICTDYVPIMVQLGLLEPIDTSKLSHWDDLFPFFREMPEIQAGDGKVWMVPVDAGLEGIMYRTDKIDPAPTSWNALFDPAYKGHIAMEDYARNAIAVAALALGYEDPFHLNEDQLQAVKAKLIEQKALLLTYFEGDAEVDALFKSGEAWISFGWTSNARWLREDDGLPVAFVAPEEGALSWVCGYAILKGTERPNAAHALIDHYLDPQIQYIEATDFEYFVSNQKVLELLSEEEIEASGLDNPEAIAQAHVEILPDNYDRWLQIWEEVLAAEVP